MTTEDAIHELMMNRDLYTYEQEYGCETVKEDSSEGKLRTALDLRLPSTVRAYSEESIKVFRNKLEKWLFHNSESVCGSNMIDIDYLNGKIEELIEELNLLYNSKNDEIPKNEARLITYASWIHSKETSDYKEHWTCSNCNHDIIENPIFNNKITGEPLNFVWCPYCGSKMIEEEKHENTDGDS